MHIPARISSAALTYVEQDTAYASIPSLSSSRGGRKGKNLSTA